MSQPIMQQPETATVVDTSAFADKMESFDGFMFERVLNFNSQLNLMFILGRLHGHPAIAKLRWQGFTEESAAAVLSVATQLTPTLRNDIYSNFVASPPVGTCLIDASLIWPATAAHIAKYEVQNYFLVHETAQQYRDVVEPYINGIPASRVSWVYNILEGTQEADRVILRDEDVHTGFILLPDLKWNQNAPEELYCVAIAMRRDLHSLRDLTADHIGLLENMRRRSLQAIKDKYGVEANQIKAFLHYHPSYYHLHIHFTHLRLESVGNHVGQAVLLDTAIETLKACGNFYQQCTLTCTLGERSPVYKLLNEWREGEGLEEKAKAN